MLFYETISTSERSTRFNWIYTYLIYRENITNINFKILNPKWTIDNIVGQSMKHVLKVMPLIYFQIKNDYNWYKDRNNPVL